ncbi:outer membrane beta-barrel protein [Brachyspira hyodysenteriae]|uniref:outer membrane beta-barrel protein n=1 Tax=Brachyspira hyodysenteriae TaxID=159 RepID=UPI002B2636B2|nr:outer membrane beta-barrel protein [Brachyspira hyodysenteriae]WPC24970.1 outer membrane beta-barrel protein [Brachyspira hyodysenteriae]
MRSVKKIILTLMMTSVLSVSAFAASGFEAILNVPIGLSVGFHNYKLTKEAEPMKNEIEKSIKQNSSVGFDIGVSAQLGYMFQVKEGFGISVLGEIGYSHDSYAFVFAGNEKVVSSFTFESIQIGLLPKFNIGAFAIGVGGGVKIPLSGQQSVKEDGKVVDGFPYKWKTADIKDVFKTPVIGYIKATFDYSIFFTDNIAMNVGLYLGYDFGMSMSDNYLASLYAPGVFESMGFSSFDIGLQLGLKFGPKA